MPSDSSILLEVKNLKVYFPIFKGILHRQHSEIRAVDDVSFTIPQGTTVGLLGESGSGKTTIGRTLVKLIKQTSGIILYKGQNIGAMNESIFHPWRKKIQMVFQDPHSSLNPKLTIGSMIAEAFEIHFVKMSRSERQERVAHLLVKVGLNPEMMQRYPHEFSGGQRQRISIARALAVEPELLICDEPVSALDVSVQAQIINLLQDLQEELGLTMLFIGHDLAVIKHISDSVLVLHHGKIVESGSAHHVLEHPEHPYTQTLLAAVPTI
ncbi:MAG: ATP-binding cassette domain-containing protein [Chthoniobacterales bacterium]|nr:ATP-binding cassette domain-containing protein [Chthoniobacterales bacterium]